MATNEEPTMDFAIGQTVYYAGEGDGYSTGETPGVVTAISIDPADKSYVEYTVDFDSEPGCVFVASEMSADAPEPQEPDEEPTYRVSPYVARMRAERDAYENWAD